MNKYLSFIIQHGHEMYKNIPPATQKQVQFKQVKATMDIIQLLFKATVLMKYQFHQVFQNDSLCISQGFSKDEEQAHFLVGALKCYL